VRLYFEVARRGFRRHATYRGATVARIFTGSIFGLIRAYVMVAVYRSRTDIGGFDVVDAVTFAIVSQGLLSAIEAFGTDEIAQRVRTGDIVTDLYRPMDFQRYSMAQDLGRALFHLLARGVPPVMIAALVFELRSDTSPANVAACILSITLAVVISFDLRFAVNLCAFWLVDIRGLLQMQTLIQMFLAGLIVPITFFPGWLETLARALPFAGTLQVPVEIFMGKHTGGDLVGVLAGQLAWAIALYVVGTAVLATATRKVVVQGG
jgi:ABC-2 type transport system permease protein